MDKEIQKHLDNFHKEVVADKKPAHLANILTSAFSNIPGLGPILSTMMSSYLVDFKINRILSFVDDLALTIAKIDINYDENYMKSEDFGYIVDKVLQGVAENCKSSNEFGQIVF